MHKRFALIGWLLVAFALVDCNSAQSQERSEDREVVSKLSQLSVQFSATYMQGDIEKLVAFYTGDAVIFPATAISCAARMLSKNIGRCRRAEP